MNSVRLVVLGDCVNLELTARSWSASVVRRITAFRGRTRGMRFDMPHARLIFVLSAPFHVEWIFSDYVEADAAQGTSGRTTL